MSDKIRIRKGSLWRFRGLDQPTIFKVESVQRGLHGEVRYITDGVAEEPTRRKRAEFLQHFEPIA